MLRDHGASKKEIQEATKCANIIRNKRMHSIAVRGDDAKHERNEKVLRKFRNIVRRPFSFKKKSKSSKTILADNIVMDMERLHPHLLDPTEEEESESGVVDI